MGEGGDGGLFREHETCRVDGTENNIKGSQNQGTGRDNRKRGENGGDRRVIGNTTNFTHTQDGQRYGKNVNRYIGRLV